MARKPKAPKNKALNGYTLNVKRGPDDEGRWYYRIFYYEGQERKTRALGWLTVEAADKALAEVATKPEEPPQPAPDQRSQVKVAHLLRAWLAKIEDERPDLKPKTQDHYRKGVTRLLPVIGDIAIAKLTYDDLESYKARRLAPPSLPSLPRGGGRLKEGNSPRTILQDFRVLRLAWNWARKGGYVDDKRLVLPPVKIERGEYSINHRTPTAAEVAATVGAIFTPWKRDTVLLLWATGARPQEILTLTWDRVDLPGGWITLVGKTGRREIPLSARAVEVLKIRQGARSDDQVFSLPGSLQSAESALRSGILKACKQAKVEDWTAYGLRRLAVDTMIRAGVDISAACSITGHSPEVMLRHYRQVTAQDKRRALALAGLGEAPVEERKIIPFPGSSTP